MENKQINKKRENEKEVVSLMIRLYCNGNHGTKRDVICDDCKALTEYANARVTHCPIWRRRLSVQIAGLIAINLR